MKRLNCTPVKADVKGVLLWNARFSPEICRNDDSVSFELWK
jgi:hypothetical protein